MSQNSSQNQLNRHILTAGSFSGVVFVIPFILMIFLGQIVCLGLPSSDSDTVEKQIKEVWLFIFEADLVHAEALLGALKKEYPDDRLVRLGSAYLSLEKGEYDQAEKKFIDVISREKVSGNIKEKPVPVRHVISLAFRGLGYINLQKSDVFNAKADFGKAFFAHADIPSYIQFAIILRKYDKDFKVSEQVHGEILRSYPKGFPNNRIQYAILKLEEGEKEEADKLISGLEHQGYDAFDWATFYSASNDISKAMDSLRIYLDRYRAYPLRCRQILRAVKSDVDFENFRKSPQFNEWLEKATVACGSTEKMSVKNV